MITWASVASSVYSSV